MTKTKEYSPSPVVDRYAALATAAVQVIRIECDNCKYYNANCPMRCHLRELKQALAGITENEKQMTKMKEPKLAQRSSLQDQSATVAGRKENQ